MAPLQSVPQHHLEVVFQVAQDAQDVHPKPIGQLLLVQFQHTPRGQQEGLDGPQQFLAAHSFHRVFHSIPLPQIRGHG